MPSHTISVHFRCPLLLFLLSFSCPICPHLSTLIFGCLHPDMPPRSMPQPVPRRPPSQSDTAHRCSLLPQKRREDSFSSHGQPRYSCHPFPAQTANFRGLCCFSQRKSHHRESLLPPTSSAETLPFSPSTACGFPSFKWMFSFKYITG